MKVVKIATKVIKQTICAYTDHEKILVKLKCLLPVKPKKQDICKLAMIAAMLGYKPSDWDKMSIKKRV